MLTLRTEAHVVRLAPRRSRPQGFALVITLSLMVLLTVLAIGLLNLSVLSLRATSESSAHSEARANARMALVLAIGELQKQLGPDQRVSANGAILSESAVKHPQWTGVWDSWHAGSGDPGLKSPGPRSEHRTLAGPRAGALNPTYTENRRDHFRAWLVSLAPDEAREPSAARSLELAGSAMPDGDAQAVRLVGRGSLGPAAAAGADPVSARLLAVRSGAADGRYAWWVGDESQKARIMDDPDAAAAAKPTLAERIFRHQAPAATGTRAVEELAQLADDSQLAFLPTLRTLDLVDGATGTPSHHFHSLTPFSIQVLADVREGGLKRDLTTLLERPIKEDRSGNPSETGDEFMLYRFDTDGQERVPLQDLAAYYQLYDGNRAGGKAGLQYSSNLVPGGFQLKAPNFGNGSDPSMYLRDYTTLYRRPVPVKVQFLLSMTAVPRDPNKINGSSPDTHKLQLGITPAVTLWNPSNVPLVMNFGEPETMAQMFRLNNLPFLVRWNKNGGQYASATGTDMTWATQQHAGGKANIFSLYFSGTRPITFKPGEVKVFSLPWRQSISFGKTDRFHEPHEVAAGWDATAALRMPRSDRNAGSPHVEDNCLIFSATDRISFTVGTENATDNLSRNAEIPGSGLQFFMIQTSLQNHTAGMWHFRDYQFISRYGTGTSTADFNSSLISKGFPGRRPVITAEPRSGSEIIAYGARNETWPFLQFALMAGSETSEAANGGSFGGRKFASRPFLHSTAISPSFLDKDDDDSFYHYGWNWWVEDINSVFEANVQVSRDNQGYYGGGFSPESGTTHVVQQEVPVVPPISIAALSHAHLGGFSLATEAAAPGYEGLVSPSGKQSFQRVTATGQGGLFPHTLQAIGNSYAHPHIPADQAFTKWKRHFDATVGPASKTLADHSYLANKALWDEFFFSSISPVRSGAKVFGISRDREAAMVANDFFFHGDRLPNRRMIPYTADLDEAKLAGLFRKSQDFQDGLADRIAAHLMVEGAFNVNSTSVEAWKVFLSSLKGKPVAYLDKDSALTAGIHLDEAVPEGTPASSFTLPNGKPVKGSSSDPSDAAQWSSWRELADSEIEELATALVRQVKQRGPFLSLSEFVNRRLDPGNASLSAKGALQAALDDESVSINSGFRDPARRFDPAEIQRMKPAFPEALEGPVAYGSAAYIDQADLLRNFAAQLTPRGDTFVIRSYGDALDANGEVRARAWCEAVVQRLPDYSDPADEPHLKRVDLDSAANRAFGRKLQVLAFRWLKPSEI